MEATKKPTRADCQPDAACKPDGVVDPAPPNPTTAIVTTGHDTTSPSEPSSIGTRVESQPSTGVAAFPNDDDPPDPSAATAIRDGCDPDVDVSAPPPPGRDLDVDVSARPPPSTPGAYDGCY